MTRLFEFSDQAWLPRCFRRLLTELLEYQAAAYRIYWPAIPKLNETLRRTNCLEILDLCSGSGGPLVGLHPHLRAKRFTLTDRFPSPPRVTLRTRDSRLTWLQQPLDARDVPPRPGACRTIFSSFHHFGPRDARRILENAVEARAPIAVFEFTERTFARLWRMAYAPLIVLRDTWRMRPRRWARVFWTYVVPLVPLIYTWDAIVSHLRTYSVDELDALTTGLTGHAWEAGKLASDPTCVRVLYLVGLPTG